MSVTANQFLELSQLHEEKDNVFSVVGCAYLIKARKGTQSTRNHCGNPSHKDTVKTAKIYLEGLYQILHEDSDCCPDGEGTYFNHILEELVKYFLCKSRHHEKDKQAKDQWSKELSHPEKRSQLRRQLERYLRTSAHLNTHHDATPERATANSSRSLPSTPPSQATSEFKPYSEKKPKTDDEIAQLLSEKLRVKVSENERKPGCLYLIVHPRERDMFKVGLSIDPDRRLREHSDCYLADIEVVAIERIELVHRIEQVILIEFDRERCKLKTPCKCGAVHGEWICTTKEKITESFTKWVNFARSLQSPYNGKGLLRDKLELPAPTARSPCNSRVRNGSRRKSDMGSTKPLERSLMPDFIRRDGGRHSDVGLLQLSSQSRFSSDEFDLVAISERFTQLTVKDAHRVSDDDSDSEESDSD